MLRAKNSRSWQGPVQVDRHQPTRTPTTRERRVSDAGDGFRVQHYTEALDELLLQGAAAREEAHGRVTYHILLPGPLQRMYAPARRRARRPGPRVWRCRQPQPQLLLRRWRGRIWMEDVPASRSARESRIREAAALEASRPCGQLPKDIAMFRDASRLTGKEGHSWSEISLTWSGTRCRNRKATMASNWKPSPVHGHDARDPGAHPGGQQILTCIQCGRARAPALTGGHGVPASADHQHAVAGLLDEVIASQPAPLRGMLRLHGQVPRGSGSRTCCCRS